MRVEQYLPDLVPYDAISDHARRLRRALLDAGHECVIHAAHVDRSLRAEARRWTPRSAAPPAGALALYHASTGSPQAAWLSERAAAGTRLAVDYHNVTPARYFDRWEPDAARRCRAGRAELAALARWAPLAVADSGFNEAELAAVGYAQTATCSLLVDLDAYRQPPDARAVAGLARRRAGGGRTWLFVGRLAPNKCQHDVIAAFALYRRLHDPRARLTLVGGASSLRYLQGLQTLCADLEVQQAVTFLSGVPDGELRAHFRTADVFVCLSEHEGFCVPLLEAMVLGVPVVAFAAAAVPETLAGAGVLLEDKDPLAVAEAVAALLADPKRSEALLRAGRRRSEAYELRVTAPAMLEALTGAP